MILQHVLEYGVVLDIFVPAPNEWSYGMKMSNSEDAEDEENNDRA
jgi:hypothetical protein